MVLVRFEMERGLHRGGCSTCDPGEHAYSRPQLRHFGAVTLLRVLAFIWSRGSSLKMKKEFQTPQEIRQQIWRELGRASQDRHHAWRTPVLATVDRDGNANARTVVLRNVDVANQALLLFTDRRSPKVEEILKEPRAMFVFWSARLNWQLRVRVSITHQTSGPQVEAQWQRVKQTDAAADYLSALAPGSPVPEASAVLALPQQTDNFTLLIAQVTEIDWLELARAGHRRACLTQSAWQWLTP